MRFVIRRNQERHTWFAWYPVKFTPFCFSSRIKPGTWAWLENVRRQIFYNENTGEKIVQYSGIDREYK